MPKMLQPPEARSNVADAIDNNRRRSDSNARIITIDGKDAAVIVEKSDEVDRTINHRVRGGAPRHYVDRARPLTAEEPAALEQSVAHHVLLRMCTSMARRVVEVHEEAGLSERTFESVKKFGLFSLDTYHPFSRDYLVRVLELMLSQGDLAQFLDWLALMLSRRERSIPKVELFSRKEEKLAGGVSERSYTVSVPKTTRPRVTDKSEEELAGDRVFHRYFSNEGVQELLKQCGGKAHTKKRATITSVPGQQERSTWIVTTQAPHQVSIRHKQPNRCLATSNS